jgi:hypothetical protein
MQLIFLVTIFPLMLLALILASVVDGVLFLVTLGLCFGKCKDKKRTWCSYALARKITLCSSEIIIKICACFLRCHCCCIVAPFSIPIGFTLVVIGFAFDLIAWISTGFYLGGFCCKNRSILEYSIGRLAWKNLKTCLWRIKNCS